MTALKTVRIGTRGSPLALAQANMFADLIATASDGEVATTLHTFTTTGDKILDKPLQDAGGKGLFTKELDRAQELGEIDIAVHSLKDVTVTLPEHLFLAAFLAREDARDCLIGPYASIADLPHGAIVGSSSLRRQAQLKAARPDLKVVTFRGNVQTRLRKLEDGVAAATFLAMAGLNRLGMAHVARGPIEVDEMLPAVAQGAIGVERRISDSRVAGLLAAIHHGPTGIRLAAERTFLRRLDGSCETPIAGLAVLDGGTVHLRGEILRPDGSEAITGDLRGTASDAALLGETLAQQLLDRAPKGFFGHTG